MAQADNAEKLRILAWSPNYSTRFLVNISIDPSRYELTFAQHGDAVLESVKGNAHAVYILDATKKATAAPGTVYQDVSGLVLRHMIRVVAIVDKAPEGDHCKMADFGPVAVVPFNFSHNRINRALVSVMALKDEWQARRDSGSRVKADPKFYKAQRFTE